MSELIVDIIPIIVLGVQTLLIRTGRVRFGSGLADYFFHAIIYLVLALNIYYFVRIHLFDNIIVNSKTTQVISIITGIFMMLKMTYWRGSEYPWDGYFLVPTKDYTKKVNQVKLEIDKLEIVDNKIRLPRELLKRLKWMYPLYEIPNLNEYNKNIIKYSIKNNRLPFLEKFDINNDDVDELILVQKSFFNKIGQLVIVSFNKRKIRFHSVKWNRPVNALFFDYFIKRANFTDYITNESTKQYRPGPASSRGIKKAKQCLVTGGYLSRVIYWDRISYYQKKVDELNKQT